MSMRKRLEFGGKQKNPGISWEGRSGRTDSQLLLDYGTKKMKEKERSKNTPERKENSAENDKAWEKKRRYCETTVSSILYNQENFYVQLMSLIIQLNLAVGDAPLEALAAHPSILYSLMVLITGLGALANFAKQPRSLASSNLIEGVRNLMSDAKRANEPELKSYFDIILQFPDEGNLFVDYIKDKVLKDAEISEEEVEMLRGQYLRTKGLVAEWKGLFQPFQHPGYRHSILENLPEKLYGLFRHNQAPGRRLLKHLLPHAKLKPSSRSISKDLIDSRARSRRQLQPWGKSRKNEKYIIAGPEESMKIPRDVKLLPYSTEKEKLMAEAWLQVVLVEISTNAYVLSGPYYSYDKESVVGARQKDKYKKVWPGLELIGDELGVEWGRCAVYDPENPQEEGRVEEEEEEEDEEREEGEDEEPERTVRLLSPENEQEPEDAEGDTLSLGAGSTFSLYEEIRGRHQSQAAEPKDIEKSKPEPKQEIPGAMREAVELFATGYTAVLTTTNKYLMDKELNPEIGRIRGQLSRLEEEVTANAAAREEIKELKEEVRNMTAMLQEMKEKFSVIYEAVSIGSLIQFKRQEKQEKKEKEKQEAAKRPRADKPPESNKKQKQETVSKAASKK